MTARLTGCIMALVFFLSGCAEVPNRPYNFDADNFRNQQVEEASRQAAQQAASNASMPPPPPAPVYIPPPSP